MSFLSTFVLKVVTAILLLALLIMICFIYLWMPYTAEEYKSPYGNATIKVILDRKLPFFSFNAGPVDGNYVIFYEGKVVDQLLRSECCYTNLIEDIKWYKDSVRFNYIDKFESPVSYEKVYKFH